MLKSLGVAALPKPKCTECNCVESLVWHRSKSGEPLCNKCFSVTSRKLFVNLSGADISRSPDPNIEDKSGKDGKLLVKRSDSDNLSKGKKVSEKSDAKSTNEEEIEIKQELEEEDTMEDGKGRTDKSGNASRQYSIRKSTRAKSGKSRQQNVGKTLPTKGRSRRVIFKKNPLKAPPAISSVVTRDYVFHKGTYWQVGDIASVLDDEDGEMYYAQLRGFLQDQYLERSVVVSWLIPKHYTSTNAFHPSHYTIGMEEDVPRKLDSFTFVCHAPSEFYRSTRVPYQCLRNEPEMGFVWSRLGSALIGPLDSLKRQTSEEFINDIKAEESSDSEDLSQSSEDEQRQEEELGTRRKGREGTGRETRGKVVEGGRGVRAKERASRI